MPNPSQEQPTSETAAEAVANAAPGDTLAAIYSVPVNMQVLLGSASMPVASLLKLGRGAVVELDHKAGEAVEIMVNNRLVARGEVVIVEDDRLGVTLTEIVRSDIVPM